MSRNSMNYKVGPLDGNELSAVKLLGQYYGMPPAGVFRYALAMLFRATQMEIERHEKTKLDDAADTNELRETTDSAAAPGDSESPAV